MIPMILWHFKKIRNYALLSLVLAALLVLPVMGALQCTGDGDCFTSHASDIPGAGTTAGFAPGNFGSRSIVMAQPADEPEYWMALDTPGTSTLGVLTLTGTTNLPAGTNLSAGAGLTIFHPTPRNYNWSHEVAAGNGIVCSADGNNIFTATVDTSLLYPGEYYLEVRTRDLPNETYAWDYRNLIPVIPSAPRKTNYINWSALSIPHLAVNESIKPEVSFYGRIVEEKREYPGDMTYGSFRYCAWDGICRVFDRNGTQYSAAYHGYTITQVPNNSWIGARIENVSVISLNGAPILTTIHEYRFRWEE